MTTETQTPTPTLPDFIIDNGDGTLSITLVIPMRETISVAKHDFTIDNRFVPLQSHTARYMDGRGAIYNPANSALKAWRDADPTRGKDATWARADSQLFVDAYLAGLSIGRTVDPVIREAYVIALAYVFKRASGDGPLITKAEDVVKTDFGRKFYKITRSDKTGKLVYTRDDQALSALIETFDAAQTAADKPHLGFMARARVIVDTRNDADIVDVEFDMN